MSTQLKTHGTVSFTTASPTTVATTTTLNGAVTNVATSFTFTSGTNIVNGTYVQVLAETSNTTEVVLVVSGSGATRTVTRAQLATAASAHSNGATVNVPGSIAYQLLPSSAVPDQVLILSKTTTDLNFVAVTCDGTNTFPGGLSTIYLIDTTSISGMVQIKFPAVGSQLILLSGVGSAGQGVPGPAGAPGAPGAGSTPPGVFTIGTVTAEWVVIYA